MRISDWSSDVCSSDLPRIRASEPFPSPAPPDEHGCRQDRRSAQPAHWRKQAPGAYADQPRPAPSPSHRRPAASMDNGMAPKRSEEHTSELQSLMRISYAVFCLKKKNYEQISNQTHVIIILQHTTQTS